MDQLIASCERHDGIASIELEKSLNAYQDMPSFFLAYEGDLLAALVSIFSPMRVEAELGALVLPSLRRRGILRDLLPQAEATMRGYGYKSELFVVDSRSEAGRAAAVSLGARLEHSEHACRYEPLRSGAEKSAVARSRGRELEILRLGSEHIEALVALRMGAFGDSREEAEGFERATFASSNREEYGAFLADGQSSSSRLVAAASLGYEGKLVSINGLVVAEEERGKGYGQAFMGGLLEHLVARGLEPILDVDGSNERAFHVYQKLGFAVQRTMEYYRRGLEKQ